MQIERLAAFARGDQGGNPAGVVIGAALPDEALMQRVAREVGYSETAFAAPDGAGWRVRYFAPEAEVAFLRPCHDCTGVRLGSAVWGGAL